MGCWAHESELLVTQKGLALAHEKLEGLGYRPPFANSANLRDVETGVRIDFLVSDKDPKDGKPSAVVFPDPARAVETIGAVKYLNLPALIQLKLAAAMNNSGRGKDLEDVSGLIRARRLPLDFAEEHDSSVRQAYRALWKPS